MADLTTITRDNLLGKGPNFDLIEDENKNLSIQNYLQESIQTHQSLIDAKEQQFESAFAKYKKLEKELMDMATAIAKQKSSLGFLHSQLDGPKITPIPTGTLS